MCSLGSGRGGMGHKITRRQMRKSEEVEKREREVLGIAPYENYTNLYLSKLMPSSKHNYQ